MLNIFIIFNIMKNGEETFAQFEGYFLLAWIFSIVL